MSRHSHGTSSCEHLPSSRRYPGSQRMAQHRIKCPYAFTRSPSHQHLEHYDHPPAVRRIRHHLRRRYVPRRTSLCQPHHSPPHPGGTSAGVAAGRLAAADPSLRVLVLETGPHTQEDPAHVQPARFLTHIRPDTTTARHIPARPSAHLGGRQLVVQSAQCVGGASSINCAYLVRLVVLRVADTRCCVSRQSRCTRAQRALTMIAGRTSMETLDGASPICSRSARRFASRSFP